MIHVSVYAYLHNNINLLRPSIIRPPKKGKKNHGRKYVFVAWIRREVGKCQRNLRRAAKDLR